MKTLIFCIIFGLIAQLSIAAPAAKSGGSGIFFESALFPVYVSRNDTLSVTTSPGVATESGIGFDTSTTLGYLFSSQLLFGFTYNYYKLSTARAYVSGGDSSLDESTEKTSYGPSLGYLAQSWKFVLTVLLDGTKKLDTKNGDSTGTTGDTTISNTKLSGIQLAIGYVFSISSNFLISPTVTLRSATYSNQSKTNRLNSSTSENYTDTVLFTKAIESSINPSIGLIFKF